jgi:hypothetical protein
MKRPDSLLPEREELRRAVAWLVEQPSRDSGTIEQASRRFDLSPLDEQFLLNYFRGDDGYGPTGSG